MNKGLISKLRRIRDSLLTIESVIADSPEFGELHVKEVEALRGAINRCVSHAHSMMLAAGDEQRGAQEKAE